MAINSYSQTEKIELIANIAWTNGNGRFLPLRRLRNGICYVIFFRENEILATATAERQRVLGTPWRRKTAEPIEMPLRLVLMPNCPPSRPTDVFDANVYPTPLRAMDASGLHARRTQPVARTAGVRSSAMWAVATITVVIYHYCQPRWSLFKSTRLIARLCLYNMVHID